MIVSLLLHVCPLQGRLSDVPDRRQQRYGGSVPEPQFPGGLWAGAAGSHAGPRSEVPRGRLQFRHLAGPHRHEEQDVGLSLRLP